MPRFRVVGTIEYSWSGFVEADDADHAEDLARERADDGMFMDSYSPPDVIEVLDVVEEPEDGDAVDPQVGDARG